MKKIPKQPWHRVRGELYPPEAIAGSVRNSVWRKGYSNPTVTTTASNTIAAGGTGLVMEDVVTPRFRELSRKGNLIVTPMSRVFQDCFVEKYTGEYYRSYVKDLSSITSGQTSLNLYEYTNVAVDPSLPYWKKTPDRVDLSLLHGQAVNEAFAAAKQRNVMGIVDIAEADKTAQLILHNLGRLENLFRYRRLKPRVVDKKRSRKSGVLKWRGRTVDGVLADASGLWLEYHYGLIPLMGTIEGLISTFTKQVQPQRQTYRGFAGDSGVYKDIVRVPIAGIITGTTVGDLSYTTQIEYKLSCRAGVMTDYRPSIQAMLGMEATDLIPAVHELIPLSFVLDWAFDIGGYLRAIQPVEGFHTLASWATDVIEYYKTYTFEQPYCSQDYHPSTYKYRAEWSPMRMSHSVVERKKIRKPEQSPYFPKWDKAAVRSLTHMISGLALGFSALKRKPLSKLLRK